MKRTTIINIFVLSIYLGIFLLLTIDTNIGKHYDKTVKNDTLECNLRKLDNCICNDITYTQFYNNMSITVNDTDCNAYFYFIREKLTFEDFKSKETYVISNKYVLSCYLKEVENCKCGNFTYGDATDNEDCKSYFKFIDKKLRENNDRGFMYLIFFLIGSLSALTLWMLLYCIFVKYE